jgi:hypothetical protein
MPYIGHLSDACAPKIFIFPDAIIWNSKLPLYFSNYIFRNKPTLFIGHWAERHRQREPGPHASQPARRAIGPDIQRQLNG